MVEHAEHFLSLYGVDMDAALEIQSPESWDSFPLFQLLNDFLRTDCKYPSLCNCMVKWQNTALAVVFTDLVNSRHSTYRCLTEFFLV